MCEHTETATIPNPDPNGHLSASTRRDFLRGAGTIGAALLIPGTSQVLSPAIATAATLDAGDEAGLFPPRLCRVSNAMHIHAVSTRWTAASTASWRRRVAAVST